MTVRVMRRMIATSCAFIAFLGVGALEPTSVVITRTAAHQATKITPGSLMITAVSDDETSACTAAFVFRNERSVFLSYAAHCAIPVQDKQRTGCEYETLPLGTPVLIHGLGGGRAHGTLAYSSWGTMRERGETDEDRCRYNDMALVEIDRADIMAIDPTMPVFGGPTGLDRTPPQRFEPIVSYQPYVSEPAVKQGVTLGVRGGGWTHRIDISPASNLGDSGSGLLDSGGAAFGILATRYMDRLATSGVTDLRLALAYAQRFGRIGAVTLVPGSRPFRLPSTRQIDPASR